MIKIIFLILIVVFSIFSKDTSEEKNLNNELKELIKSRLNAFIVRDTTQLNKLCIKNYLLITPSGLRFDLEKTKEIVINSQIVIKNVTLISFQSFVKENESFAFSVSEIKEEVAKDNDIVVNNLLITEVYIKEKGVWKIQLTHTSQKACFFPK